MAGQTERLAIVVTGDSKGAVRELQAVGKTAEKELGRAEDAAKRTELRLAKFGVAAVAASTVAAAGLYSLGKAASDMEQAVGGAEAIFGEAVATVKTFGETSADAFGISRQAALQLTTTTGALLKGFGFTQQAAADTSVRIAKLGADLSALSGGKPEEAVAALGAALRGEFNPLERFGVSLNVAQANLRAVELGLADNTAQVDLNARAQAALSIIFERTADAQGQFARESDTAAGRLARNTATFKDLKAEIGQGVLPALNAVLGGVNNVLGAFSSLDAGTKAAVGTVATLGTVAVAGVGSLALLASAASSLRRTFTDASGSINNFGKAAAGLTAVVGVVAAIQVLDQVMASITDHAGKADEALRGLLSTKVSDNLVAEFDELSRQIDSSRGTFGELGATISDVFGGDSGAEAEMKAFKRVVAESIPAAERLVDALGQRWGVENVQRYRDELDKTIAANKQLAEDQQALTNLMGYMGPVLDRTAGSVDSVNGATRAAADAARDAAAAFGSLVDSIRASFAAATSAARAAIGIADANQRVADAQSAVAGTAKAASGGIGGVGASALDAERKVRAVADALRTVEDAQRSVIEAQDAVPDAIRGVAEAQRTVEEAQRGVADAARAYVDAQQDVRDAVRGVADALRGVDEAHRRVAESQRTVEDSAIAVADAERRVTETQRDAQDAASDLVREQENLRRVTQGYGKDSNEAADAQDRLNGALRDSKRATLAVADAQDRLAQAREFVAQLVEFGYTSADSELLAANRDVAKAQLDVEEAQARVASTADDASEAQRQLTGTTSGFAKSSDEVTDAAKRVADAEKRAERAVVDAGKAARDVEDRQIALAEAHLAVGDAARGVEDAERKVEDAHRAVDDAGRAVEERHRDIADADRDLEAAHRGVEKASKDVETAHRDVADALLAVEAANFRVREAEEARSARIGGGSGAAKAVTDQAALERDLATALLDQRDAYEASAEKAATAAVRSAEIAAALRSETIPEQDKAAIGAAAYVTELGRLIDTLEPGSPLRRSLEEYRQTLFDIPADVNTTINLETRDAARKLEELNTLVNSDFDPKVLAGLSIAGGRAIGGAVDGGGLYRFGEGNRPEVLTQGGKMYLLPGESGRVTPASTAPPSSGGNVSIGQVVLGKGGPQELVDELRWMMLTA